MDMLAAGYVGYGYIFYGNENGSLKKPEIVRNKNGKEVFLGGYWDYDQKKWIGYVKGSSNLTMMKAVDWDEDGDYDLVLSSHPHGRPHEGVGIQLVINEGSKSNPVFSTEQTMVINTSYHVASAFTDWDGDGLWDIIATVGEHKESIGIFWYRNKGVKGAPKFDKAQSIFSQEEFEKATGMEFYGAYLSTADYNNDGKEDLIIGTSMYKHLPLDLTTAQIKRRDELKVELDKLNAKRTKIYEKYNKKFGDDPKKAFEAAQKDKAMLKITKKSSPLSMEYYKLLPKRAALCPVYVSLKK